MYLITETTMKSKAKRLAVKEIIINQATNKPVIININVSKERIEASDRITLAMKLQIYAINFKGFTLLLESNGFYTKLTDATTKEVY